MPDERERDPVARLPHPESLCARCAACRLVTGRATVFVLCTALPRKYPPQPVRACAAFQPRGGGAGDGSGGGERGVETDPAATPR